MDRLTKQLEQLNLEPDQALRVLIVSRHLLDRIPQWRRPAFPGSETDAVTDALALIEELDAIEELKLHRRLQHWPHVVAVA